VIAQLIALLQAELALAIALGNAALVAAISALLALLGA
jgi:hypothetical protein